MVRPGDVLTLTIEMEKVRANMGMVDAVATVAGQRVCTAKLVFFVAERQAKL